MTIQATERAENRPASRSGEVLLRRPEAAKYLLAQYGVYSTKTLAKLACQGGGPLYRKIGRIPVYAQSDLDSWVQSKLSPPVRSTSEYPPKAA